MRIFCIENGLRDRHSHYLQEAEGLAAAAATLGDTLHLYAHRRIEPALAVATGAVPAFHLEPSTMLEQDPVFGVLSDYIALAPVFAADCAALTADGAGPGDLVLLPYAEAWSVRGLALWLDGLAEAARPRVACHFVMPERNWWLQDHRRRFSGDPAIIRHAATTLARAAPPGGLRFAAVAPGLAALVESLAGQPCATVPMPMHYPPPDELDRIAAAAGHPPVDICIAGQFRREKGGDLIAATLAGLARSRPGIRVAVQVNDRQGAAALADTLGPAAEQAEIFLHVGECGREEWYGRILAARLMLLPYEPESYAVRTSGIFAEAAACGIPAVVPADTWLADQIAAGHAAGVAFTDFTAESILAAIAAAEANHPTLTAAARHRRAYWQQQQTITAWLAALRA